MPVLKNECTRVTCTTQRQLTAKKVSIQSIHNHIVLLNTRE